MINQHHLQLSSRYFLWRGFHHKTRDCRSSLIFDGRPVALFALVLLSSSLVSSCSVSNSESLSNSSSQSGTRVAGSLCDLFCDFNEVRSCSSVYQTDSNVVPCSASHSFWTWPCPCCTLGSHETSGMLFEDPSEVIRNAFCVTSGSSSGARWRFLFYAVMERMSISRSWSACAVWWFDAIGSSDAVLMPQSTCNSSIESLSVAITSI